VDVALRFPIKLPLDAPRQEPGRRGSSSEYERLPGERRQLRSPCRRAAGAGDAGGERRVVALVLCRAASIFGTHTPIWRRGRRWRHSSWAEGELASRPRRLAAEFTGALGGAADWETVHPNAALIHADDRTLRQLVPPRGDHLSEQWCELTRVGASVAEVDDRRC
jgi:hypothetical protein